MFGDIVEPRLHKAKTAKAIQQKSFCKQIANLYAQHTTSENITYDWLFIPSNHNSLDPASYTWKPTIGKRGKKKDTQTGWETNIMNGCKMSIVFSMSSQLWINIEMTKDMKQFIIATATVKKTPVKTIANVYLLLSCMICANICWYYSRMFD